ncbi:MAG: PAS domain-containing sensor histidine kinase, partial [Myxococcota bacterium]|nr:PAS domain-containing sensor histidine kinase [Myxococcota bacterium]
MATTLLLLLVAIRHLSSRADEPLTAADHASYAAIGGVYVLTLLYAVFLRQQIFGTWLGYLQVVGDIVLASALVLLTGGPDSPFTFVYSLAVVNGAILLSGRGAFFAATLSTFAFVALLVTIPEVRFTATV